MHVSFEFIHGNNLKSNLVDKLGYNRYTWTIFGMRTEPLVCAWAYTVIWITWITSAWLTIHFNLDLSFDDFMLYSSINELINFRKASFDSTADSKVFLFCSPIIIKCIEVSSASSNFQNSFNIKERENSTLFKVQRSFQASWRLVTAAMMVITNGILATSYHPVMDCNQQ